MERYGQVIKVKPEFIERYKELHGNPWPQVNKKIKECNIQNYSIYFIGELLFSYFEYTGENFQEDMKKMAEDEWTQKWWKETDPCQCPIELAKEGDWWTKMEEVYHLN